MLTFIYCSYAIACIFALWRAARWVDKHHPALRDTHAPKPGADAPREAPERNQQASQRRRHETRPAGQARVPQRPGASAAACMVL
ncbi:hypothetical protein ACU4GI_00995 [Cupriavidus basilensis]|nr:hypothetical protein [Cupriavidus basilensis]